MRHTANKVLSIILSLVLVAGLNPAVALADDGIAAGSPAAPFDAPQSDGDDAAVQNEQGEASGKDGAGSQVLSDVFDLSKLPSSGSLLLQAADIASGTTGTCSWSIDSAGVLTIFPTNGESGTIALSNDVNNYQSWHDYADSVTSLVVRPGVAAPQNARRLFADLSMTTANVKNLDVSETTSFEGMFWVCKNLEEIDLSGWDTANVTDLGSMFYLCGKLKSVNLAGWNTQKVTTMGHMFTGCKLESIDLSQLNLSKLTSMDSTFFGNSTLTEIKFPSTPQSTPALTYMGCMFYGCSSLATLDLSGFDTSNVTSMNSMFYDCAALTSLDFSSFDTRSLSNAGTMFSGCKGLTSLDLSMFETPNLGNAWGMFRDCQKLQVLNLANLDVTNVGEGGTTNALSWTMAAMFRHCYALNTLTLGPKFANKAGEAIEFQDLPEANENYTGTWARASQPAGSVGYTSKQLMALTGADVAGMWQWLRQDGTLGGDPDDAYVFATLYDSGDMVLRLGSSTDSSRGAVTAQWKAALTEANDFINGYEEYPAWRKDVTSIKKVVIANKIAPVTMKYWFSGCTNLEAIEGVQNLDTSHVTSMYYSFYRCNALSGLDVSAFDTSRVSNMSHIFESCGSLASLDVSDWNTSSVRNMNSMFSGCAKVSMLDVTGFDTSRVADMGGMFSGCNALTALDVSRFDTSHVTDMSRMFYHCVALTALDASGFDGTHVLDARYMFGICSALATVNLPDFTSGGLVNTASMFASDKALTALDLSRMNTENVTDMGHMFDGCNALTALDVTGLDTSHASNMGYMFWGYPLESIDVSGFDTSNATNMSGMFGGSRLTTLDLSGFDTSNVTYMQSMFCDCGQLQSLNMSGWNTGNVQRIDTMFCRCSALKSLDLSGWNTSNISNMDSFFYDCKNLEAVDESGWDTSKATTMHWMFRDCPKLESLDLSSFDTRAVTDMSQMFAGDTSLASLSLGAYWVFPAYDNYSSTYDAGVPSLTNDATYTGKWVKTTDSTGVGAITSSGLMGLSQGDAQGEWVWQRADGSQYQPAYALLYENGDLVFQRGDAQDASRGAVSESWTDFESETGGGSRPWSGRSEDIRRVVFEGSVAPATMRQWFANCKNLTSVKGLSKVDSSAASSMASLFNWCSSLTSLSMAGCDTSQVTDMSNMFAYCGSLVSLNVLGLDTSKVADMSGMFLGCGALAALDVSKFDTSQVENMSYMFSGCSALAALDVSGFNTSKVTDMLAMFGTCRGVEALDVSHFDTSNVTRMTSMFDDCLSVTELDVSGFDTKKVTDFGGMFERCSKLKELDVSKWNTLSAKGMQSMFKGCSALERLDLSSFSTASLEVSYPGDESMVEGADWLLYGCTSLSSLAFGEDFTLATIEVKHAVLSDVPTDFSYTGKWLRASDGALCTSAELLARSGSDIAGTWTWEVDDGSRRASRDGWGFANSRQHIPAQYYFDTYGDAMGRTLYDSVNKGGDAYDGVCYGMATTAISSSVQGWPAVSAWEGAGSLYDVKSYSTLGSGTSSWTRKGSNLTALQFVEYAHLAQLDWEMYFQNTENLVTADKAGALSGLVAAIGNAAAGKGDWPVVLIYQDSGPGGHALWPLRIAKEDDSVTEVAVYDCNYPGQDRTLYLYKSDGAYTGWSYEVVTGNIWGTTKNTGARISWNYPTQVLKSMMARKGSYDDRSRFNEVFRKRLLQASAACTVKVGGNTYSLSSDGAGDSHMMGINPVGYAPGGSGGSATGGEALYWSDLGGEVTFEGPSGGAEVSVTSASGGASVELPENATADMKVAEGQANSVKVEGASGQTIEVSYFEDDAREGQGDLIDLKLKVTAADDVETSQAGGNYTVKGAAKLTVVNDKEKQEEKELDPTKTYTVIPNDARGADPVIVEGTVAKPTAKSFTYDGRAHTAVTGGDHYTLSGTTSATNVGTYTVTATPDSGWAWSDGTTDTITLTWKITQQPSQTMHRLYNPYSGEHFYTANTGERDHLVSVGWRYEGEGWKAPTSGADVYRMYNPYAGDHHYTTSAAERDSLVRIGWRYEGVGWKSGGSTPLYRQYNPYAEVGTHNYTTSKAENDNLVRVGWRAEGVGWYGV